MLSTKEAWLEILNRHGNEMDQSSDGSSIYDQIQKLYRENLIAEPQRDAMREYVKTWLGDGSGSDWDDFDDWDWFAPPKPQPEIPAFDKYACGLWAATAAPWGAGEQGIILMALQILFEEAE